MSAKKSAHLESTVIDEAIAWHEGDMRATIATRVEDCQYLREQLDIARHCMSNGLTRGWKLSLER
ncbi:hypothetical protein [Rhizobium mongolense]|uniref:Uncharacterized protein n=1 Tax=Rhizobium mongolense TaxID=57676 RepID=A0A7W6RSF3_9HYPH|nr:hypothetical protein [Rhizobium mongolense]MBB4277752.1 hypothetical protein [Rhizobium mongolense]